MCDQKLIAIHHVSFLVEEFFSFIYHIYPLFTRKRIVSLYFGRYVRTRLEVAISEASGPPVFYINAGMSR